MTRRVVVTGIGAITPIGAGRGGLWEGLCRGKSVVAPITRFDSTPFAPRLAAEIPAFDPLEYLDPSRARHLDRFGQLAVVSGCQAVNDAGLSLAEIGDVPISIGSALGGIAFAEEQHRRFLTRGFRAVDPSLALVVFGGAGPTSLAIELGTHGPVMGNANSCASGLVAIGEAFRLLRVGPARVALAGGVEAPLAPLTFGAFARIKAMSIRNDTPATACRPFDQTRDGFVMAEGAAILVLEEIEHALARGARPLAEILGYGTTTDGHHMTVPLPDGREAARAMSLALADGQVAPEQIGYLNAHATGTRLGDAAEARAIRLAFGKAADQLAVSGTKGLHGHALGASGAIGAAITALALAHEWIPPTANLTQPEPAGELTYARPPGRDMSVEFALTNAFGFGGINASLLMRRW